MLTVQTGLLKKAKTQQALNMRRSQATEKAFRKQ
jgi:hypothetical protein